jgi:hypothetical protein
MRKRGFVCVETKNTASRARRSVASSRAPGPRVPGIKPKTSACKAAAFAAGFGLAAMSNPVAAAPASGGQVDVDYMMRLTGDDWLISDFYLDGAIIEAATRRSEFCRHDQNHRHQRFDRRPRPQGRFDHRDDQIVKLTEQGGWICDM